MTLTLLVLLTFMELLHVPRGSPPGCQLSEARFRENVTLREHVFQAVFVLDLQDGLNCLKEVKTSWHAANQSTHAYAAFYDQFYAFRRICVDPPASSYTQAAAFDYGVFGSSRGGGESRQGADVDLVGSLRDMVSDMDPKLPVSVVDWYMPTTDLFNRLRDAHVNFQNGITKVAKTLPFAFFLQDDASGKAVVISAKSDHFPRTKSMPNGQAKPRIATESGSIRSIGGMEPMLWFEKTILDNSAFPLPFKSMGARANALLKLGRRGFAWLGSTLGDVSKLQPSVKVSYANGSEATWSWSWLLLTKDLAECPLTDGSCYMDLVTRRLKEPSSLHLAAFEAARDLEIKTQVNRRLSSRSASFAQSTPTQSKDDVFPAFPGEDLFAKLDAQDEKQQRGPGIKLPSNATSTRRWLVDPENHPSGATYGYFDFQEDEDGKPFAVMKITQFFLRPAESQDFDFMRGFVDFWTDLVRESATRGVNRLLVDVVGNSGGYVNLAFLFVRALFPLEAFQNVCSEYDRPIGSLYEAFTHIDRTPFLKFLNDTAAISRRVKELREDVAKLEELRLVTSKLTKAGMALDILDDAQLDLLTDNVDVMDSISTLDGNMLLKILQNLNEVVRNFGNPFAQELEAYSAAAKPFDPYEAPVVRSRGGYDGVKFTAKYRAFDCASVFSQDLIAALEGVENPFGEILVLTDGLCGSSCDTATRTSYLLAKKLEADGVRGVPKINFITYGGLGGSAEEAKKTLSATSFPGGNVEANAMEVVYNPVLVTALFGYLTAEWAGIGSIKHQISEFRQLVPEYPFYNTKLPKYSQSEIYQNPLGGKALPTEYYFFATDIYLPEWYANVDGMPNHWDESELAQMHQDAARAFGNPGQDAAGAFIRSGKEGVLGQVMAAVVQETGNGSTPWVVSLTAAAGLLLVVGCGVKGRCQAASSEDDDSDTDDSTSGSSS